MSAKTETGRGRGVLSRKLAEAALVAAAGVAVVGLPFAAPMAGAAEAPTALSAQPGDGRGMPGGELFGEVTDLLGLGPREIVERLRGGQSLAEIGEDEGVARAELTDAVEASVGGLLDRAEAAGRLSDVQRDALGKIVAARVDDLVERVPGEGAERRPPAVVGELADLLGLPARELGERFRGGESLAEIAAAEGVERAEVVALLERAGTDRLDEAARGVDLSAEERAALEELVGERVERIVDAEPGDLRGPGRWQERERR